MESNSWNLLIPQMAAFDGSSDRSIVVLDNCSIHHVPDVVEEFRKAGVMVPFLPPYSPDSMPIELCFSYIKYYLKNQMAYSRQSVTQASF